MIKSLSYFRYITIDCGNSGGRFWGAATGCGDQSSLFAAKRKRFLPLLAKALE
jgi:hypothetical protein